MDLRNKDPISTFQYLVNTDGTSLYDGSGSLLASLAITTVSSSFAISSSQSNTSSFSRFSLTSSFGTSSYIVASTASIVPANTSSIVAWLALTVSGSIYKLPLYQ